MRRLLIILITLIGVVTLLALSAVPSFGAATGGDGPGGTVTVGASAGGSSGPVAGGPGGAGVGNGASGTPWTCTYVKLVLNDEGGIAPGGPTPGSWYSVTCNNGSTGATLIQTEWIPDQSSPATPAVDPRALALEAERSLGLPSPAINFNPPGSSVVNLPTWLWIDRSIWHAYSVTASAGPVSATAVATPMFVTWTTGDGSSVSCGPGVPYDSSKPASQQTTSCAHAYRFSSAGQPSPDGNPDDGAFVVSAVISWSVQWTAQGAPGGGPLPVLATSSSTRLRVEQVESTFTDALAAGARRPLGLGPDL